MVRTPWLLTSFGNLEAIRQCIQSLEAQLALHLTLVFREDLSAELFLEILADNPHNLTESCLNGIIDTIVHNGLAIGAQTVKLLQATITATHACC